MNWLLDTCVLSELVRKNPQPAVIKWIDQQQETSLFISVLTIAEIEKGVFLLDEGPKRAQLENWILTELASRFKDRIIDINLNIANAWALIQASGEKKGRSLPTMDSLIAATAIAYNLTLVTRNTKDMIQNGVQLFDPWNGSSP